MTRDWARGLLAASMTAGLLAGCAGGGSAAQELTITATEYKYETSGSAVPGSNLISLKNSGKEVHHVQLFHLAQGKTMQDLGAGLQAGDLSKLPGKFEGGVGQLAPGGSGELEATLAAGTYAMLCFVPAPDGAPHFVKGMMRSFDVQGEENRAAFKAADVKLTAKDYAFDAPEKIKAGEVSIELTNAGKEFHEANLFRLATGVTPEQALKALESEGAPAAAGPPPFTPAGGPQGILPGEKTQVVATLDVGNYLIVCFIPDAQNVPHIAKGMVKPVAVE
ncbi:MAG: hypothetical protein IT299_00865 [Dehalococcoidia bacterium]|nr:hypothetical protein [Dehalococcoidia bacterium]